MAATSDTVPIAPDVQVQAIRSRVNEIVRRFDESLAENSYFDDDDDDDDEQSRRRRLPARWKVGDVLMATHNALSKTSTRTERIILSEFTQEDPEVAEAMGRGEHSFGQALAEAEQKAQDMHALVARSLVVVKQLQAADEGAKQDAARADGDQQQTKRELKQSIETLRKEKHSLIMQLQEQVKANKDVLVIFEDQSQELKRVQISSAMKSDELKTLREDYEQRITELQQTSEAAQQVGGSWKEKWQLACKTSATAETKVQELEVKTREQHEELIKCEFMLQVRTQEIEKLKESVRESEMARLHAVEAEAAATAQLTAALDAARAPGPKRQGRPTATDESRKTAMLKENQDLLSQLENAKAEARALTEKLHAATHSKQQFEHDNYELARVVRELQERAKDAIASGSEKTRKRSSSLCISLRSTRNAQGTAASPTTKDDDLSTTSDDEDEIISKDDFSVDVDRDEETLNQTMHDIVATAFPSYHSSLTAKSDDTLCNDIAAFEGMQRPRVNGSTGRRHSVAVVFRPSSLVAAPAGSSTTATVEPSDSSAEVPSEVPSSEIDQIKAAYDQELERMKNQYVTGLLEYKELVIEQYERRQSEAREKHRIEVEQLIVMVQGKFRREIERRNERMQQSKESLKLLYRALRHDEQSGNAARTALPLVGERDNDEQSDDDEKTERTASMVPLKMLLRAAILAMSTSSKRNDRARQQISDIYEAVKKRQASSPRQRTASVSSKADVAAIEDAIQSSERHSLVLRSTRESADKTCQVNSSDLECVKFFGGLRGSSITPECMDNVTLPSAAYFPHRESASSACSTPTRRDPDTVLYLTDGATLSANVVADLRRCLPALPRGAYYLSRTLRQLLFRELVRYYAAATAAGALDGHVDSEEVEVIVGSPRDTPFLRRKALEGLEKNRTQRRKLFAHGGAAILQPPGSKIR